MPKDIELVKKAGVNIKELIKKLNKAIAAEFTTNFLLLYLAYCTSLGCNLTELDVQKETDEEGIMESVRLS